MTDAVVKTLINAEPFNTAEGIQTSQDDSDSETFKRLAVLSNVDYDRARKGEAKKLGITLRTLDQEVKKARGLTLSEKNEVSSGIFPTIEPWNDSVTAEELLNEVESIFKRFSILPDHADTILSLWVIFTWCIDSFDISPILTISSPEKRCGKTTVLSILGKLVFKPIHASNITPSSVFRTVELWGPTLLIDEADTFIRNSEELRGIINSGHTRPTAYVIRTVGDNHTPTQFSTWGAKAIALIGSAPDTIHDRSIVLTLRRKLNHEKTQKLRHADHNIFNTLQRKLQRFSNDYVETLRNSRPNFPERVNISDRALDNWEPLLAIAELAGDKRVEKVYQAALSFFDNDNQALPTGTELLRDIQKVFAGKNIDKVHTADLINHLCEDPEAPWLTYSFRGQDKKITSRQLGKLLTAYGIRSKNITIEGVQAKGFEKHFFEESWERYIFSSTPPKNAVLAVHPSTTEENCVFAGTQYPSTLPSTVSSYPSSEKYICPSVRLNTSETAEVDGWTANMGGVEEKNNEKKFVTPSGIKSVTGCSI